MKSDKKEMKYYMFVFPFFVACSSGTWSEDERNKFLDECKLEGGSSSYCKCYLEKVMAKYPNHSDAKELDFESAVEMAKSCE